MDALCSADEVSLSHSHHFRISSYIHLKELEVTSDVAKLHYACNPSRSSLVSQCNTFCFFPFVLDEMASLWTEHLILKQSHFFDSSKGLGGHCFLLYEPSLPSDLSLFYMKHMMMGTVFRPDGTSSCPLFSSSSSLFTSSVDLMQWVNSQQNLHFNQLICFRHFDAALFALTRNETVKKFMAGIGTALVIGFNEYESSLFITCHDSRYSQKAVGRTSTSTRYGFAKVSLRSLNPI